MCWKERRKEVVVSKVSAALAYDDTGLGWAGEGGSSRARAE